MSARQRAVAGPQAKWMAGHIKWFNLKDGYGFVTTETAGDVLVPMQAVLDSGVVQMRKGARVNILVDKNINGKLVAHEIQVV